MNKIIPASFFIISFAFLFYITNKDYSGRLKTLEHSDNCQSYLKVTEKGMMIWYTDCDDKDYWNDAEFVIDLYKRIDCYELGNDIDYMETELGFRCQFEQADEELIKLERL